MRKTKAAATPPREGEVTYLLHLSRSNYGSESKLRRITVPASWRVTFGPLVPGKEGRGQPSLRFYEGENQRACFTDVESFREESIKIEERVTREKRQTVRKNTPSGQKDVIVTAQVSEWINPDKPEDCEAADQEFIEQGQNLLE